MKTVRRRLHLLKHNSTRFNYSSSLTVRSSLENPHLCARLRKSPILPDWAADIKTPYAGRA